MSTSKVHHVTSRGRASGQSSTSFQYPLWVPRDHNRITLIAAQIPKTYYLVDSGYNTFTWSNTPGVTYTVPPGNYTYTTFAAWWNASAIGTTGGVTISTSQAPTSLLSGFNTLSDGLFRFHATSLGTLTFPEGSQLPLILGFIPATSGDTTKQITGTSGQYTTSDQVVDFTATSQIYITCDKAAGVAAGADEKSGMLSHFFVNQIPDLSFVTFTNPAPIDTARVMQNEAVVDPTPRLVYAGFSITGDGYSSLDLHGHDVDLVVMTYCEHDYWTLFKYYVQAQSLQMLIELEKQ